MVGRLAEAPQVHGDDLPVGVLQGQDGLPPPAQLAEIAMDQHQGLGVQGLLVLDCVR